MHFSTFLRPHKHNNKITTMLKSNPRHTKSMSCSTIQREIARQYPPLTQRKHSEATFVPFHSERRLGRLISSHPTQISPRSNNNQQLLQKITFRNFEKVYRMVMKFENRKYSQETRSNPDPTVGSGQRDLINHEWKVNVLSLPEHKTNNLLRSARPHKASREKANPTPVKFQKMNEFLYKKLTKVEQPKYNKELQALYSNYIQICEMNQNIRRTELLGKAKTKMLS